ncbi:UNVERIFIED_CONTAM: hypothetical protein RMT77_003073 [Armadillidium vulgare]
MTFEFTCSICSHKCLSFSFLLSHYKSYHEYLPNCKILCGIDSCQRVYKNVKCLRRHIAALHQAYYIKYCQNNSTDFPKDFNGFCQVNETKKTEDNISNGNLDTEVFLDHLNLGEEIFYFLLSLKEFHKVTWKGCQFVLSSFENLVSKVKEKILHDQKISENAIIQETIKHNVNLFETTLSYFSDINRFNKYLLSHRNMVSPVPYSFGAIPNLHSLQYIPILKTLNCLLQNKEVIDEVFSDHRSGEKCFKDICDGQNFKRNMIFNETSSPVLQLQLYCDDVCLGNPLGNKIKQMKMTFIYFTLCNVRPELRSKLKAIHLLAICNADLFKKRRDHILKPLLDDINVLEKEGISLPNVEGYKIKGTLVMICGDNLSAHFLGGFD